SMNDGSNVVFVAVEPFRQMSFTLGARQARDGVKGAFSGLKELKEKRLNLTIEPFARFEFVSAARVLGRRVVGDLRLELLHLLLQIKLQFRFPVFELAL